MSAEGMGLGLILSAWLVLCPPLVHIGARRECNHGLTLWAFFLAGWAAAFQTFLAIRNGDDLEWNSWLVPVYGLFFGTFVGVLYTI